MNSVLNDYYWGYITSISLPDLSHSPPFHHSWEPVSDIMKYVECFYFLEADLLIDNKVLLPIDESYLNGSVGLPLS